MTQFVRIDALRESYQCVDAQETNRLGFPLGGVVVDEGKFAQRRLRLVPLVNQRSGEQIRGSHTVTRVATNTCVTRRSIDGDVGTPVSW